MRLLTFRRPEDNAPTLGVRSGQRVLEVPVAAAIDAIAAFPGSLKSLLAAGPNAMTRLRELVASAQAHDSDRFDRAWRDEQQLSYLPPIADADKFLCVGKNYRQHLEELQRTNLIKEIPEEPTAFVKLNSSLVGHRANVVRPEGIVRLDYEPELVFVIGRRALGVRKAEAFKYVAAVTILNDLTDRDAQEREVKSSRASGPARTSPASALGPELITLDEDRRPLRPLDDMLGERPVAHARQHARPDLEAARHPRALLALHPDRAGRHVLDRRARRRRGRQENAAELFLKPGDVVECGIEGFATLRTTIVAPPARDPGPISQR
jgi:5-carboxymethyl-2-hydroxymuconate isomerase/acylpyruvate hydrolase